MTTIDAIPHNRTFSRLEALELAKTLTADDGEGWSYQVHPLNGDRAKVAIYDEEMHLIGYF